MDVKRPLQRKLKPDVSKPKIEDLIILALERIRNVVEPDSQNPPPLLFPWAESMRWDFFTYDDWSRYGNLETEHSRLTYTLTSYPERGPPSVDEHVLRSLLREQSVLESWSTVFPVLQAHAMETMASVLQRHQDGSSVRECTTKSDFVATPVDYDPVTSVSGISLHIWKRSLREIAARLANGTLTGRTEFLQIHAFLKDPIYGSFKPFETQQRLFGDLLERLSRRSSLASLSSDILERVAAQAAQESSYLANPLLKHLTLIHFHAHHQLPYIDVPLDSLARAEFSVPTHVLEVAEEMLQAAATNEGKACPLVPILVTTCPHFVREDEVLIPIVDGNHRATAVSLLRFLAGQPLLVNRADMKRCLLAYCRSRGLGVKWQVDLSDVLDQLYQDPRSYDLYSAQTAGLNAQLVHKFATVEYIPALVVQEADFHTICKQRSLGKEKPVLLHPFHQTLFNDDDIPLALPQKAGQTHGRPEGFRLLPLKPFGTVLSGVEGDGSVMLVAELRKSMNGLGAEQAAVRVNDASHEVQQMDGVKMRVNGSITA